MIDIEAIAKGAVDVATAAVTAMNPIAGVVMKWAGAVVFEIYDQQKNGGDPVAAAELAGDRVADLVEELKLGGK